MEKRYRVIEDLQGTGFAMGVDLTIEEWRDRALDWAEMDEHYGIAEELKSLPKDNVLDYISEFWQLEFGQIDIYDNKYNYDDIKIAVVIAETFKDWNVYCDYEDIAQLVIMIRNKWKEYHLHGYLVEEEFAYMQKWATNYLNENKTKLMEELR